MTFRIREARIAANLTQQQLADMLNISYATLSGYETGAHDPRSNMLAKIADICKVTVDYLLGIAREEVNEPSHSEEAMRVATDYDTLDHHGKKAVNAVLTAEKERVKREAERPMPTIKLLHFEHPTAAGEPLDAESDSEYVAYPVDEVPEGSDYTVTLDGQSMEPDYPDKSTVFIHRTVDISDGDVVIAWLDGKGMTCKRAVMDGPQIIRLESINREFDDYEGEKLERMRVYGKVIGYI